MMWRLRADRLHSLNCWCGDSCYPPPPLPLFGRVNCVERRHAETVSWHLAAPLPWLMSTHQTHSCQTPSHDTHFPQAPAAWEPERKPGPALGSAEQTDGDEERWHSIRPPHLLGLPWLLGLPDVLTQLILVVILRPAVWCHSSSALGWLLPPEALI